MHYLTVLHELGCHRLQLGVRTQRLQAIIVHGGAYLELSALIGIRSGIHHVAEICISKIPGHAAYILGSLVAIILNLCNLEIDVAGLECAVEQCVRKSSLNLEG